MSAETPQGPVEKIAATIRRLESEIGSVRTAVGQMESSARVEFEKQVDLLMQRQRTVAERLARLQNSRDAAVRQELQKALEKEVQELQKGIGQVRGRVPEECCFPG